MVRRQGDNRAAGDIRAQIIEGRDGRPAYAVLPFEVFVALVAYARKGGLEAKGKVASRRLYDWLRGDDFASAARLFTGEGGSGKTSFSHEYIQLMLSDDRMEKALKDVSEWLLSRNAAARHAEGADDAEDVAAYDAAKMREEEEFSSEVADRLITGANPIKVFREYRGLTQKQLAKKADTSAAYLSQIETGQRTGSLRLLHRLAEALDVGLDDLV